MSLKQIIKRTLKVTFLVLVYPLYLLFFILSKVSNPDSVFQSFSQLVSLIPGKIGIYTRAAFYRLACPETSDEILIGFLTVFSHVNTTIEEGVYIGPQCNIGKCRIGKNTLLGSGVHILSGSKQHHFEDIDTPIQQQGGTYEKITIGEDCWLGNVSVVMADVGNHSIVASGSVVTRPVEPKVIVAGNPAKHIKNR